jgi:endoglucanase
MRQASQTFLERILEAPSPSGYEQPAAAIFREYVDATADEVATDVMGNVHATLHGAGEGPSVMLAGHMDEIGFMVTYVTDDGYIAFKPIGGWDAHVLPGCRVDVHTKDGAIRGVMGRMPVHLLEEDERKKVVKMHKLFVDVGLQSEEVCERVRIGDPITMAMAFETFGDGMAVSRGFDDKIGAWAVAEVLRQVKDGGGPAGDLTAVATVQEEVGLRGGHTSAYSIDADVGIAVEVGHATDYPDVDKRNHGKFACGEGPIIARGPNVNPVVFDLLLAAAESRDIPYQVGGEPRGTGTDANAIQVARGGKAAGLVSVPLRYMHTPSEVLCLADLEHAAELLAAFVLGLESGTDFTP